MDRSITPVVSLVQQQLPLDKEDSTHVKLNIPKATGVGFLNLPHEVREMIYKIYFHNLYIMIKPHNSPGTYDGNTHGIPQPGFAWNLLDSTVLHKVLWPLFLSCSTVFSEARYYLLSEATFVFFNAKAFVRSVQLSQISGLPLRLPGQLDIGYYVFGTMRHIWLDLNGLSEPAAGPAYNRELAEARNLGRELCLYLSTKLHSATHLNIVVPSKCTLFWLADNVSIGPLKKHALKALLKFENLDRFALALQRPPGTSARALDAHESDIVHFLDLILQLHVLKDVTGENASMRLDNDGCSARALHLRYLATMSVVCAGLGLNFLALKFFDVWEEVREYLRTKWEGEE